LYAEVSVWLQPGTSASKRKGVRSVSILWIILIVVLVLALLGFFTRGYW
jgi:flagellar basal body-associated protein FliL